MLIGTLDREISIYKRTFRQDAFGERQVFITDTPISAWARIEFKDGSSKFDADAFVTNEPVRMIIRYTTEIGTSPEFYINSKTYGNYLIRSIQEIGRKEGLILICDNKNVVEILDS
jgi:head-tail adaptor